MTTMICWHQWQHRSGTYLQQSPPLSLMATYDVKNCKDHQDKILPFLFTHLHSFFLQDSPPFSLHICTLCLSKFFTWLLSPFDINGKGHILALFYSDLIFLLNFLQLTAPLYLMLYLTTTLVLHVKFSPSSFVNSHLRILLLLHCFLCQKHYNTYCSLLETHISIIYLLPLRGNFMILLTSTAISDYSLHCYTFFLLLLWLLPLRSAHQTISSSH